MKIRGEKAQVTIFVILAIVIVGAIILFFAFTDSGRKIIDPLIPGGSKNAGNIEEQLTNCILEKKNLEGDIIFDKEVNSILKNGGEKNPKFFYLHQSIPYKYLCYSANYYEPCVNQQPLLVQKIENEIKNSLNPTIESCIEELKADLNDAGFDTRNEKLNVSVDIIGESINIKIDYPLKIKDGENVRSFDKFEIKKTSGAYQLILVADSIVSFETKYGDSDPIAYMSLYPNNRIEKLKQSDGTTLYKISDRTTMEEMNFATRSYAIPIGYNLR